MPISFNDIPANWKQPLYWVEVDGSMAGLPVSHMRSLLVGVMLTAGVAPNIVSAAVVAAGGSGYAVNDTITLTDGVILTVATVTAGAVATVAIANHGSVAGTPPANPVAQVSSSGAGFGATFTLTWVAGTVSTNGVGIPNVPIAVGRQMDADHLFGQGSELACMFRAFFANNFANELWALPVPESTGGARATGTITVTSPPTEAGTIALYIAGYNVEVNVGATDTVNTIAQNINDAINSLPSLPVSATVSAAIVTLTCKWMSVTGNDITLMLNYYGKIGGEELPVGLALTMPTTLTGGVGVPSFTTAISNMGETEFEYVALPYTDSTTLLAWEFEYGFGDTGRWGWMRQLYGHIFASKRDIYSNLITWGLTRNGRVTSVLAIEPQSPSPTYEWTAAYCAKAARALINDPARPLQTLNLDTILPAPFHARWDLMELNAFSMSGLGTQRTWQGNVPAIARETTTYQLNEYGLGDDAFELVTTLATLAKLIRNQRYAITTKYPRVKLADDDTKFGPGQAIVTPKIIKAELIAQYAIDQWNGLVENTTQFKAHLIVERDPNDPNRLNVLYPPDLINQLRIFAVLAQFRLQYDRGLDTAIIGVLPVA
jgi:phage tail sheath gpL-like